MRTVFRHAWILTMDEAYTEYRDGWLMTEGTQIAALGAEPWPETEADEVIDCQGGILLPGFVNTHCHASMVPFRTLGDDCADRLRRFLFPLEKDAMTPELACLGARYGMAEMLLGGTTTFTDMYYFQEQIAQICLETGMRGYMGETVISQPAPDSPEKNGGLQLAEAMLKKWAGHRRIRPVLAPHGTKTVQAETLKKCHALAREYDTFMTLHACETDDEMQHFAALGITPIQYLDSIGCLSDRLLAVHCIHVTEADIALMARRGARVAHCIGSNMKAGKGICPVRDLARAGIRWGLGTDGPSSGNTLSMFDQMRLFAGAQKTRYRDRTLFPARSIVRAATAGGAEALGDGGQYGMLLPGMSADITLVSVRGVTMFPMFDPYSMLVYSASARDVSMVMADGVMRVRDGVLAETSIESLRNSLENAMGAFIEAAERYADVL